MAHLIPTRVAPSVQPEALPPRRIANDFRKLVASGGVLRVAGEARKDPSMLLSLGYTPKHAISLFGNRFFLTNARRSQAVRFFVAYVVPPVVSGRRAQIYARIFYKDLSLVWRSPSHLIANEETFWIGKGDIRTTVKGGYELIECVESTTDLPLEMQTALETISRGAGRARTDEEALFLILRGAPNGRVEPYRDFTEPRRLARADRRNLINGGRSIARFTRKNDPTSLVFAPGFEPDFLDGILEIGESKSAMYGGTLKRFRILSRNQKIQYLFMAGSRHVWIIPPQATTTELSTYGVRTIDVAADEDLFVPGFEYHYFDEAADESEHFSQIPPGFAGELSEHDNDRADASAWLDAIPVIREFRHKCARHLASPGGASASRRRAR